MLRVELGVLGALTSDGYSTEHAAFPTSPFLPSSLSPTISLLYSNLFQDRSRGITALYYLADCKKLHDTYFLIIKRIK